MLKKYCTQNGGDCDTCSLSSYNKDCKNNRLLTETEDRIVELIATQALSNLEIAQVIGCSERTVETHLHNIFAKTGYRKRGQIILHYNQK